MSLSLFLAVVLLSGGGPAARLVAATGPIGSRLRRRVAADPTDEAAFLRAVAAELRAGAPLAFALDAAAAMGSGPDLRTAAAAARAGSPISGLIDPLRRSLPVSGRRAAFAIRTASASGGAAAATFDRLAAAAVRAAEGHREVQALTAQARLSAWVVAGAPLAVVVVLAAGGGLGSLWGAGGVGRVAVIAGLALIGIGLGVIVLIQRGFRA